MDFTGTHSDVVARPAGLAAAWLDSAAGHLKSGWPEGSDPRTEGAYTATPVSGDIVILRRLRHRTLSLAAFGAGIAVGILAGLMLSPSRSTR